MKSTNRGVGYVAYYTAGGISELLPLLDTEVRQRVCDNIKVALEPLVAGRLYVVCKHLRLSHGV